MARAFVRPRRCTLPQATGGVLCTLALGCAPNVRQVTSDVPRASMVRELTPEEQAHHVLNRLAFGPRPGDVTRVTAMGVDQWIAQQLVPHSIDDSALERVLTAFPAARHSAAELYRLAPPPGQAVLPQPPSPATNRRSRQMQSDERLGAPPVDSAQLRQLVAATAVAGRRIAGELQGARVARAVSSERQLQEVLTDFWLNHFSVFVGKGQVRYHVGSYEREAIRPHILGRFRDLLGAVAHSPAMLLYLDNAQNVVDSGRPTLATDRDARRRRVAERAMERRQAEMSEEQRAQLAALRARRPRGLNENYARELLELHTLGVDGGYTQQDIVEVARAFTGWTVRPPRAGAPEFWFNGAAHDAGDKVVLGVRLRGGRGKADGEQVLDILARHPSTAQFIARKLVVRFVSDAPPEALVARAAATFQRTDGDLQEVMRTILLSPEFFSRAAYRSKVKSPFEVVVSAARALGALPDTTSATALAVARLGQPVYGRQTPDGWPEVGHEWMNTGAIVGRINVGLAIAGNRLPGTRLSAWPGYAALRAAPREVQVDGVIAALLGNAASSETREILLSGVNPLLSSDTTGGRGADDGRNARADDADAGVPSGRMGMGGALNQRREAGRSPLRRAPPQLAGLDQIVGLALGSPDFQRR